MPTRSDTIRQLLSQGPMPARQLIERLSISQPTMSRALRVLGDDVVRIGAGPSIQYALRDTYRGFRSAPIYRITDEGRITSLGELIPVRPNGFVMMQTDNVSLYSDGLPWWLFDMRPQGYLGRAYASAYAAELGLPANPDEWADADVVRALLAHGHDAIGNLLIGEQARDRFLAMPEPTPVERATTYPALALAAGAGEAPGSSAGGEQPKFCTYTERGHVLVKFSAPDDNPVSERWRDLLLAEHLALRMLGVETEVFDFGGQRFLEVPRFDRVDQLGRIGVFSLRALDAEFVGNARASWPVLVKNLITQGHVHPEAAAGSARLWAFGALIGNTDMHHGNLSFISRHGRPYHLAPAYDILPMGFAPRTGGAIVNELRPASLPEVISGDTWREALNLAENFFAIASGCDRFSARFAPCLEALHRHLDEARSRIARLE
ncbi:type II toxin-antitoxin system HipA family toxin YjjJ [Gibbsiella quercinecans]|uniref:Phosphatidylinositol kinase n=2 Tax=Gibbsiella quercinecans TaxID=929813 RepID=A0A250B8K6_9GAMM|nr:type II toxin-antitoxin system HipA family toxin YjjJ [Gibbsiella quercinecans]ATA22474.1 phosphatidylinositol kinase [Gibbsiella quercinecans]RLM05566.1 phosphatidylinositol kinase [Gibbsiella quercinecans]RLM10863.1 phosphatidylinositol kinase [Gibbsiella quercinecans]